jgi:regulator of sigma E protease
MEYILYFIITIGILVFVHEFGHFASAKLSKMRVDVFALGFGKRLLGFNKVNGFTFGNLPKDFDSQGYTDYRLSLLPLGGYVKIAGMVDESFDTKFAETEPKPYEFRAKKTLPKLFVISAGVMMNLSLTLLIFWGINFFHGKQFFNTTTVSSVETGSDADKAGFKSFDKILSINGVKINSWDDVIDQMMENISSHDVKVMVERNNIQQEINIPKDIITQNLQKGLFIFPYPSQQNIYVQEVMKNSPAADAGMKSGDILLSINNIPLKQRDQVIEIISSNKEKNIPIIYLRGDDTLHSNVNPGIEGKIGISFAPAQIYTGKIEFRRYGFFASVTHAFDDAVQYTVLTFTMLKDVIIGKIAFKQAFGGPLKIAQFAAKSADIGIIPFLHFLAMLSLSLAIINILPFPVLDGGHVVIIALEGIFKRELPIKIKIAIQNVGFVLLLCLMAFILYNDVISLWF